MVHLFRLRDGVRDRFDHLSGAAPRPVTGRTAVTPAAARTVTVVIAFLALAPVRTACTRGVQPRAARSSQRAAGAAGGTPAPPGFAGAWREPIPRGRQRARASRQPQE